MLVMIEYIFMFRIVKKMQNSGLEIVAGLTLPLSSILCYSITHVFHKQHVTIFCATVNFGDNLILIHKHTWIIFVAVSSNSFFEHDTSLFAPTLHGQNRNRSLGMKRHLPLNYH